MFKVYFCHCDKFYIIAIIFQSKKNKPAEWGRFKFKFENAYIHIKVKLKPDGETRSFSF